MSIREWLQLVLGCLVLCGLNRYALANNYTTSFPLTENPISEGGNWENGMVVGIDWSNVVTTSGMAYGTQQGTSSGNGEYSDSTALLTGTWGPTQTVQATVDIKSLDAYASEEVELRLHQTLSAHSCTGYEVTFSINPSRPYIQVVRWNGPLGNYTYVNGGDISDYAQNGDVLKATISAGTISVYKNGALVITCADSTYSSGNPGMGFFVSPGAASTDSANFGFSSYSATDGQTTQAAPLVSLLESPTNYVVDVTNPLNAANPTAALTWSSSNATKVVLTGFGFVPLSGTTNISPSQTTNYTATASGSGGTNSASVTVNVPAAPTNLRAGPP